MGEHDDTLSKLSEHCNCLRDVRFCPHTAHREPDGRVTDGQVVTLERVAPVKHEVLKVLIKFRDTAKSIEQWMYPGTSYGCRSVTTATEKSVLSDSLATMISIC